MANIPVQQIKEEDLHGATVFNLYSPQFITINQPSILKQHVWIIQIKRLLLWSFCSVLELIWKGTGPFLFFFFFLHVVSISSTTAYTGSWCVWVLRLLLRAYNMRWGLLWPLSSTRLRRQPRLTLWFKHTRLFPSISSSGSSLAHVHTHTHTHTRANTHARTNAGSVRWKSSWRGGRWCRWETQQGPSRSSSPAPPCCCCAWTCRPRSQFGSHEVDVGFGQGEERQAPLELRHVLNQRGLRRKQEAAGQSGILTDGWRLHTILLCPFIWGQSRPLDGIWCW